MNSYSLAAIFIITVGVGFIAFLIAKSYRETVKKAGDVSNEALSQPGKIIETAVGPVSRGLGHMLHAAAERIQQRQKELDDLRSKVTSLTQECEQLRNRHVNVDQLTPIFQLAFFQADFSEINFVKTIVKTTPEKILDRKEEIEYLGVFKASTTQKLGIDIAGLKFRVISNSKIEVYGLSRIELIGNVNTDIKPLHSELRRHLTKGQLRGDDHEVIGDNIDIDGLRKKHSDEQFEFVHKSITQRQAVEQIDKAIEKVAIQYLRDYFAPRGYSIDPEVGEAEDGATIFELRDAINSQLDEMIHEKASLLTDYDQKKSQVAMELKQEIRQLPNINLES